MFAYVEVSDVVVGRPPQVLAHLPQNGAAPALAVQRPKVRRDGDIPPEPLIVDCIRLGNRLREPQNAKNGGLAVAAERRWGGGERRVRGGQLQVQGKRVEEWTPLVEQVHELGEQRLVEAHKKRMERGGIGGTEVAVGEQARECIRCLHRGQGGEGWVDVCVCVCVCVYVCVCIYVCVYS